jgi:hypothetical protein
MSRSQKKSPKQLTLPFSSLEEAIQQVLVYRETDEGVVCPCCTLIAKVYLRRITGSMARVLIRMALHHEETGGDWMDVTNSLHKHPIGKAGGGGDWSKPKYWHLIEQHPEEDLWRITAKGLAFARGLISIEKKLKIFNDKVLGVHDATPVTIRDCLGKRFKLEELYEGLGSAYARRTPPDEYHGADGLV